MRHSMPRGKWSFADNTRVGWADDSNAGEYPRSEGGDTPNGGIIPVDRKSMRCFLETHSCRAGVCIARVTKGTAHSQDAMQGRSQVERRRTRQALRGRASRRSYGLSPVLLRSWRRLRTRGCLGKFCKRRCFFVRPQAFLAGNQRPFICAERCLDRTARLAAIFSFCTKMPSGTSRCTGAKFQIAFKP